MVSKFRLQLPAFSDGTHPWFMWLCWVLSGLLQTYLASACCRACVCVCVCVCMRTCAGLWLQITVTTNYSWLLLRSVYFEKDMPGILHETEDEFMCVHACVRALTDLRGGERPCCIKRTGQGLCGMTHKFFLKSQYDHDTIYARVQFCPQTLPGPTWWSFSTIHITGSHTVFRI